MDPQSEAVLSRPAPPPAHTRAYGSDPAQVYDVRVPTSPMPYAAELAPSDPDLPALPSADASAPSVHSPGTVLVVHGGFWRAAYDRTHAASQAAALAQAGWHVAVGEYRRVGMPGGGVPGTLDDITALVAAVVQDPDLPDPLVLMGHSAGGHLVAWAANQSWAAHLGGVVALAGCVDLGATDRMHLGGDAARAFLGEPRDAARNWQTADPMASLPARCPVRLIHGALDREVPVEVSDAYLAAMQDAGADVTREVIDQAGHYSLIDPEHPAWSNILAALNALASPRG